MIPDFDFWLRLLRNDVVPPSFRLRAARRARAFASGRSVNIPCRLDEDSWMRLLARDSRGRLILDGPGGGIQFLSDDDGSSVHIPVGGRVTMVTPSESNPWAAGVDRVVTRYDPGNGRDIYIETTRFDAQLLHEALVAQLRVKLSDVGDGNVLAVDTRPHLSRAPSSPPSLDSLQPGR